MPNRGRLFIFFPFYTARGVKHGRPLPSSNLPNRRRGGRRRGRRGGLRRGLGGRGGGIASFRFFYFFLKISLIFSSLQMACSYLKISSSPYSRLGQTGNYYEIRKIGLEFFYPWSFRFSLRSQ